MRASSRARLVLTVAALLVPPAFAGEWELVGPGGGGRITSIREDPSDPDTLFLTINVGGARRSIDGGRTWRVINRGLPYEELGLAAQKLADIAIHPRDGRLLLAAGLNGCIVESRDRGERWRTSHRLADCDDLGRFCADPGDPDVVYVAVGSLQKLLLGVGARRTSAFWPKVKTGPTVLRGTWRASSDEALADGRWEWSGVGSVAPPEGGRGGGPLANVYSVGIDPFDRSVMYCVTERGLYQGQIGPDGRVNRFTPVTSGLPERERIHGGQVVFDPRTRGVAYLTLVNLFDEVDSSGGPAGGVFKSCDGGRSWARLSEGLEQTRSNHFDLQLDPRDPGRLYLAQFWNEVTDAPGNLYRSTDAGASWVRLLEPARLQTGWKPLRKVGPDFVCPSRADGQIVRWSNGGGMLFHGDLSAPGPTAWTNLLTRATGEGAWATTGSEAIAWAASVAIDPRDPRTIYLPFGDHAWFRSDDGGASLQVLVDFAAMKRAGNTGDTAKLRVDEQDPDRLYAATRGPHQQLSDGGVMTSRDGGRTWTTIGGHLRGRRDPARYRGLRRGPMTDLLVQVDGALRRRLWVAQYREASGEGRGGVFYLADADGQDDWERISPALDGCRALAALPDFTAIYAGFDGQGLFKLVRNDEGQWRTAWGPLQLGRATTCFDLETGAASGDVYAATDDGLFRLDAEDRPTRLPAPERDIQMLELHPKDERIIFVAAERGSIHRSTDGGQTWSDVGADLPTGGMRTLQVDPAADAIWAVSPGAGVWRRRFP